MSGAVGVGCGNVAARLDTRYEAVAETVPLILNGVRKVVLFGIGRASSEPVELLRTLRPLAPAGEGECDPWKD
jgi:hypothetical protein